MSDIVERLEDASNAAGNVFEGIFQDSKHEIERLRAENATLRAEVLDLKAAVKIYVRELATRREALRNHWE